MTNATIVPLSRSMDIPFNQFVLSQANVRQVKAGQSVEQLSEDIALRGLLQSLNVRPVLDGEGAPTGTYEGPAGGRRFRALEQLVKAKRLPKTAGIPCVIKAETVATSLEDDSLPLGWVASTAAMVGAATRCWNPRPGEDCLRSWPK